MNWLAVLVGALAVVAGAVLCAAPHVPGWVRQRLSRPRCFGLGLVVAGAGGFVRVFDGRPDSDHRISGGFSLVVILLLAGSGFGTLGRRSPSEDDPD